MKNLLPALTIFIGMIVAISCGGIEVKQPEATVADTEVETPPPTTATPTPTPETEDTDTDDTTTAAPKENFETEDHVEGGGDYDQEFDPNLIAVSHQVSRVYTYWDPGPRGRNQSVRAGQYIAEIELDREVFADGSSLFTWTAYKPDGRIYGERMSKVFSGHAERLAASQGPIDIITTELTPAKDGIAGVITFRVSMANTDLFDMSVLDPVGTIMMHATYEYPYNLNNGTAEALLYFDMDETYGEP